MKKRLIKRIAKWLVKTGYKNTIYGNYHISFEETADHFNLFPEDIIKNKEEIAKYIDSDKRILSETWVDEDFDMNFCGDFEE